MAGIVIGPGEHAERSSLVPTGRLNVFTLLTASLILEPELVVRIVSTELRYH